MRMTMPPTVRVVASWICVAAGGTAMALGGSPGLFLLGLVVAHCLRRAVRPPIPDVSQRSHPVLSLSLIILFLAAIAVVSLLFPDSFSARVVLWIIGAPLIGFFLYEDIRVSREMERVTG
jgi:ABC-type Fe3+-siderophore transport system permease subunit